MNSHAILRATTQQLRAFEATARLLSVTRAAEELGIAQPTVSLQLRELVGHVGMPLFEQQGRRLHLTEAGEELLESVREVFAVWSRFESRIAELKGVHRGTLRLAAVTTAEYLLPQLLGPFCEAYPGVEVQLAVENRATILQRLDKSLDDLTVMMLPPGGTPSYRPSPASWPNSRNGEPGSSTAASRSRGSSWPRCWCKTAPS